MAAQLHFNLVSPERQLASRDVHMVVVPGEDGDFGVLAGHAPFMSTIRPGVISIYENAGGPAERIFIDGGFAEIGDGGLTILAEQAQPVADLNAEAVAQALAEAREQQRIARTDAERPSERSGRPL
ncbi:ATP synthase F1 subunit epsilon [Hankyongella ginsenosidimutans]|uniref:ATP synthase epsilon chain n=1 Tax=Hankyongella ginsenosidimutans TaxID=1763828 RepID=A0A4D7C6B6_9SPHN|nr:ATP synthase F1 subunit epsilon [Hankyongella ginsenosidimutans]QCI79340.1 ATP synthase F1 subunit epsilon [Hankyongella ginsenosidimutans]